MEEKRITLCHLSFDMISEIFLYLEEKERWIFAESKTIFEFVFKTSPMIWKNVNCLKDAFNITSYGPHLELSEELSDKVEIIPIKYIKSIRLQNIRIDFIIFLGCIKKAVNLEEIILSDKNSSIPRYLDDTLGFQLSKFPKLKKIVFIRFSLSKSNSKFYNLTYYSFQNLGSPNESYFDTTSFITVLKKHIKVEEVLISHPCYFCLKNKSVICRVCNRSFCKNCRTKDHLMGAYKCIHCKLICFRCETSDVIPKYQCKTCKRHFCKKCYWKKYFKKYKEEFENFSKICPYCVRHTYKHFREIKYFT